MEQLIPIINEIQDVFSKVDIAAIRHLELPQIVVVGSQSSGKSSVLEALVGKDFLPRGSGIVTRRPLVLQLNQLFAKEGQPEPQEWAEFLHKPGKKFFDFQEVKREIEAETDAVAGRNKNISPMPITLKVYSHKVLTLTLVDLPGLVRNAIGDQPKDIDKQVSQMVYEYVKQPNTIILAVSAANADLATSDGLQMAQRVDKEGNRTLGVLTKLDLMDPGTDASDILENKLIKLKRGFIGVVNRGQRDLESGKPMESALSDEASFFSNHPIYKKYADRCGTPFLMRTLSNMLLNHIRDILPQLRQKIDDLLKMTMIELQKYGGESAIEASGSAKLLELLTAYANAVNDSIAGRYADAPKNELWGGARINFIFHDKFVPFVSSVSPARDLTDDQIRMAIANSQGNRTTLFPSQQAFELLLQAQIRRLEDPCMRCISFVFDELVKISEQCAVRMDRYPNLRRKLFEVTVELLRTYRPLAEEHVKVSICSETTYINTNHPDFDAQSVLQGQFAGNQPSPNPPAPATSPATTTAAQGALVAQGGAHTTRATPFDDIPGTITHSGPLTDKEQRDHRTIRTLIEAYFKVVRKTIADQTPKVITYFLINRLTETLRNYLVEQLYKEALIADLLKESDEVSTRRKAAQQMFKCLSAAKDVLNKVRDSRIA
jgi:replication fork clamp-binding protein CrfC